MSKSPDTLKLFGGAGIGFMALAAIAVNFADRNVAEMPAKPASTVQFTVAAAQDPAPAAESSGILVGAANATEGAGAKFGLGRAALPEEVAAWDIDVPPGATPPPGSGDVWTGEEVFADNCAVCHGDFAEGRGNWPKLAGGADTLADEDPLKTVGSYWPHLSTVWDYVNRSMPFGAAQTLSADDVYAITAYILYSNDLVDDDFTLSDENFAEFEMYNADGFIIDDRAETEYAQWRTEPCMSDCKDSVEITMRATVLDVTPDEAEAAEETVEEQAPAAEVEEVVTAAADQPEADAAPAAALNPELVAAGENVFKKCRSCHQVGADAKNKTGPVLNGIVGHPAGAIDGFKYSKPMQEAAEAGLVWTEEELKAFLAKPRDYMKGTKMSFAGLRKDSDLDAIVEYLKSVE